MDKKQYSQNLIKLFEELFIDISTTSINDFHIQQFTLLMETLLELNDKELYSNSIITNIIYFFETQNFLLNKVLLLLIQQYKIKSILKFFNTYSINTKEIKNDTNNEIINEDDTFIYYKNGNKKLKNNSDYPEQDKFVKLKYYFNNTNQNGTIYTINDKGYVVSEVPIVPPADLNTIDFNEVYTQDIEEILTYQDYQQLKESDIINDTL